MKPTVLRETDASLVRRTVSGDARAFDALAERYRGVVYQASLRRVGDESLAWDATQETFLAAYRGLSGLRRPDRFGPWLRRIAQRSCARLLRGASRTEPAEPEALERMAAGQRQPRAGNGDIVRRALAGVSPTGRRAAELHYFDGLSCEEVARFVGISVGAVKTRLYRSREELRRELTRMGAAEAKRLAIQYVTHWGGGADNLFYEDKSKEFYAELYPRGSLKDEPWAEPALSREQALAQVARWEALGVVGRRGNAVTCLMPVVTDEDEEIMRPWREEIAERAAPDLQRQIPEVRAAIEKVYEGRPDSDNVFITLLLVYAMHWGKPLGQFRYGIVGSQTERGSNASYWCSGEARTVIPPGYGLRNRSGRGHEWCTGVVNAGHRYPRFDAILDKWGHYFSGGQSQILATIGEGSVGEKELPLILRAAGYDVADKDRLLADFQQAKLIKPSGKRWRLAIPVFHERDHKPIARACDRLGAKIVEAFEAAMPAFERRVARCSFRKCAFADVFNRMFFGAADAIIHHAIQLGLLPFPPEKPSGDWGVFLLFLDGQSLS